MIDPFDFRIRFLLWNMSIYKICFRYYEKDALVADPDYGSILSSLLVGPCALDYSRTKTPDHFWTDPPADELVSFFFIMPRLFRAR